MVGHFYESSELLSISLEHCVATEVLVSILVSFQLGCDVILGIGPGKKDYVILS